MVEAMQLSFNVVKNFSGKKIVDEDLVWLCSYPDNRMLSDLGLTSGQAELLRTLADKKIVEVAAFEGGYRRLEQPFFNGLNALYECEE
jgi:hypothetical protein